MLEQFKYWSNYVVSNANFQNVHLHEDQLETVMSVLEESNVEIRHSLHKLLSSCKLNSQVLLKQAVCVQIINIERIIRSN